MNQRVLSSSSMMLKGVTLKSSDWRDASATGAELYRVTSNPRLARSTSGISIASTSSKSSQPRKMSNGSSQSSFHRSNSSFQQLQRLSSSSLASMASSGLASRSSNAAMGNATWDSDAKQPESLNMFDLKISEPKTTSSNPFLDGTFEKKAAAPRRSSRTLRSDLLTLQEELRCSFRHEEEEDGEFPLSKSGSKRSLADIGLGDEFVVCTFQEKMLKEIDTRNLSSKDLDSLKLQDPFMYYSIPAAKKAEWMGTGINLEDIHSSRPVKRRSAISFESADLLDGFDFAAVPSLPAGYYQANVDCEEENDLFMSIFD